MDVADDQVAHQVSGVQPLHDVFDELLNGAASCVHPEVRLAVGREALIIKLFHPQPIGGQRPAAVAGHALQDGFERRVEPDDRRRRAASAHGSTASAKVPPPEATTAPRSGSRSISASRSRARK